MLKITSCAMFALISAGAAVAQDTVIWQDDIQGWSVAIDRTIEDSCFIISGFEDDLFLRFQFNASQENLQFIVASMDWESLETGRDYEMEVAFGNMQAWSGTAVGHRWKDVLPSLVLSVPLVDQQASHFMREFTEMGSVQVSYDGSVIANLALAGADEAVASMLDCQATMTNTGLKDSSVKDPFAGEADQI